MCRFNLVAGRGPETDPTASLGPEIAQDAVLGPETEAGGMVKEGLERRLSGARKKQNTSSKS